ncbi:MAG: RecQ family ATP-dependent DNA helicase, partial [Bacteroidetes bacterium]
VDAANLEIDHELYRFRKQRHEERMQAAIAYATQPRCRSVQLRTYFGEEEPAPCGICDVCLEKKKKALSVKEVQRYLNKFRLVLQGKAMPEEEFLDHFPPKRHPQIQAALQYLLEEGYLNRKDGCIELVGGEG